MFTSWRSESSDGIDRRASRRTRARRAARLVTVLAVFAAVVAIVVPVGASGPGIITTIAGNGTFGSAGDGGPATSAQLFFPSSAVSDTWGNTVIADASNCRLRVVAASTGTFYGVAMIAGDIYTVAGGRFGFGGDGGPSTAAQLAFPQDVATDKHGNILIADTFSGRVRVVAGRSGTFYGVAMTVGDIYTVAGSTFGNSGDGGPATKAQLNRPIAVSVDKEGDIGIADFASNSIRVVAAETGSLYGVAMTAGDIYTVAGTGSPGFSGDGGPATSATFNFPDALAVDGPGNLVVVDSSNNRVRVVAARTANFYGVEMTTGNIYTVAGTGAGSFSGDGEPATSAALNLPNGVAVNSAGDLLIADSLNNRVRAVAGVGGSRYGVRMVAGDMYTVAGSSIGGFAGDGGRATSASLSFPLGVGVDSAGDIIVADSANSRIRLVTA